MPKRTKNSKKKNTAINGGFFYMLIMLISLLIMIAVIYQPWRYYAQAKPKKYIKNTPVPAYKKADRDYLDKLIDRNAHKVK